MSFQLIQTHDGLGLVFDNGWKPIVFDFLDPAFGYRQRHVQGRNELIAKAIGWHKQKSCTLLDTTAGYGKEAFLLATLGVQIHLLERNDIVFQLLQDALHRAAQHPDLQPIVARMHLTHECAIAYLQRETRAYDVIYCDPMFAPRKKSAAVKKEMQALAAIVGQDVDCHQLVQLALAKAKQRVVVKRSSTSQPIAEKPDMIFEAKSHCFDVYITAV